MEDIILHVPAPPSANRIWRVAPGYKRPIRSNEYKAWLAEAGWIAKMQAAGCAPIACRFDVRLEVPISRRDTDNWVKPLLDLCQNVGVITNDGNQNAVRIEPVDRTDCMIALTPLPALGAVRAPVKPRYFGQPWQKPKRKGGITTAMLVRR